MRTRCIARRCSLAFAEPSRLASGDLQRVRDYIARFGDAADVVRPHADRAITVYSSSTRAKIEPGISFAKLRYPVPSDAGAAPRDRRAWSSASASNLQQLEQGVAAGATRPAAGPRYRSATATCSGGSPPIGAAPRASARRACISGHAPRCTSGSPASGRCWKRRSSPAPAAELPANEWGILNESPGGFALRHIRGAIPALRVGDLIGVRSRDRGDVFVCLVRWILSETAEHIDIGLQQLAPRFAPATYRRIDGRAVTHVPVLFAPSSPHFNRVPVVVLPAKLVTAGTDFVIQYLGGAINLRAERALESTPHAELFQVSAR